MLDALKVLGRYHPKVVNVGSYVATAEFRSSHWKVFLGIDFPKT